MELERNIEKELKAYAQQRQAAAGASPELPAVKRKLLQEEAARLTGVSGGETRSWWQPFWSSRPRLAVAGFAVIAVVMLTWWLLPVAKDKRHNSRPLEMARNRTKNVNESLATREYRPRLAAAPAPQHEQEAITLAPGSMIANSPAPLPAAPATANVLGIAQAPAALPRQLATNAADITFLNSKGSPSQTASADRATSLFSHRNPDALDYVNQNVAPVIQQFLRTNLPLKTDKTAGLASGTNVLVSFHVEQTGDKLRMVDGDGSVYDGFVAHLPETPPQSTQALRKAAPPVGPAPAAAAEKQSQPTRVYHFRVTGVNRTLNENVVFTGNFLTGGPAPSNGPATGGVLPAVEDMTLPLELQKARVEGRLLLGRSNKIFINATPVKP